MAAPTNIPLRVLAGNFLVGYASASGFLTTSDTANYQATAATQYSILTPENAMKWGNIHGAAQGTYDFSEADRHVAFGLANQMVVKGHNICWSQSLPSWLTGGSWTSGTLTSVLYDHIDTVVGRYKNKVTIWDVINEPINTTGFWQSSAIGSTTAVGGYVDLALRRARLAAPNATLLINEYGCETVNATSNSLYSMCQTIQANGTPLDGVGFQMHIDSGGIDYASFATNMARFAALGLQIYISEMDVRIPDGTYNGGDTTSDASYTASATDLANQATVYQNVLAKCLAQPACKGLQTWGFTDAYTWIYPTNPTFFGYSHPLPFDENYNPKSAYNAMYQAFWNAALPPKVYVTVDAKGRSVYV